MPNYFDQWFSEWQKRAQFAFKPSVGARDDDSATQDAARGLAGAPRTTAGDLMREAKLFYPHPEGCACGDCRLKEMYAEAE